MIAVRLEGGQALAENLRSLSKRVRRNVLIEALTDAAEPMRRRMATLAPREPGAPDMADHIAVQPLTAAQLRAAGEAADEFKAGVAVGPEKPFYYGFYQEFGTVRHGAQPFARPAFDSEGGGALGKLAASLWTELAARGFSRSSTVDAPVSGGPGGSTL